MRQTLILGQVNLVLLALVTMDCLGKRTRWPRGALIGIAAAVKLTPAAFVLYFLLRKDWKAAATAAASGLATTLVAVLIFPAESIRYWGHMLTDSSRIGYPWYAGNQSIKGFASRLFPDAATGIWLTASVVVAAAAIVVMGWLLRVGADAAALMVNVVAILLVSPVSWSHHWVWAIPALVVAADAGLRAEQPRRAWLWAWSTCFALLICISPHWLLPHGGTHELSWSWWQQIAGSSYVAVAAILLLGAAARILVARSGGPAAQAGSALTQGARERGTRVSR
jgi:alpha-1,2-mannosyltransferase